jgi:uncharacterized protein (TIGR03118 family)
MRHAPVAARLRLGLRHSRAARVGGVAAVVVALAAGPATAAGAFNPFSPNEYHQTNLVSDQPNHAAVTDPNLVNAWGMATSPTSPVWVSDNGADVSTLYSGAVHGSPVNASSLVVSIPGGAPTGQVFNDGSGFKLPVGGPALFLFAGEDGQISGWNKASGTSAQLITTTPDAVYKGLTLADTRHGTFLYAANFHAGTVDVWDSSFQRVHRPFAFRDPFIPQGYAPFNVQEVHGFLVVTYAKQDAAAHDDAAGPGHGFVDVFTPEGFFLRRLATRGVLNSPWGVVLAPSHFGRFSNALLIGNFGDGRINAFDPITGFPLGALRDEHHQPLTIDGLWGLRFGNGTIGSPNTLLFSAGPDGESHGLFGEIDATH